MPLGVGTDDSDPGRHQMPVASSRLQFGSDYYAQDLSYYVETVRTAEAVGLDLLGHGDSQNLWNDVYVALTLAALNTTRMRIGPMVTNPVTRHPAVTAAALSSLQELTDGRVIGAVGGGDSALLNIGAKPATLKALAEYVTAVRNLTARRPAEFGGQRLQLGWDGRAVPVFMAAEGPRKLRLAGAIADGVIVGNGLSEDVVRDTIATVAAGARDAGRSPDDVEIWWIVNLAFGSSWDDGIDDLLEIIAGCANFAFRFTTDGKRVPPEHADGLRELMSNYDHSHHASLDANPNRPLVDRYGLRQWLGKRFAIAGTPEECADQLRTLAGWGARNWIFTQLVPDQIDFMRRLRSDVLDRLQPLR